MGTVLWKYEELTPVVRSGGCYFAGQKGYNEDGISFGQGIVTTNAIQQLINNPSAEVNFTDSWTAAGTASGWSGRTEKESLWGISSFELTMTTSTASGETIALSTSVTSTGAYQFSFWYKFPVKSNCRLRITVDGTSTYITSTTTTWTRANVSGTASGTFSASFALESTASNGVGVAYVDGVMFTNTSYLTPYIDGSLEGCTWASVAHNSTSSCTGTVLKYGGTFKMGSSGTAIVKLRSSTEFNNSRGYNYYLFSVSNGSDNKNKIDLFFRYDTGNEGKLQYNFYDFAGDVNTSTSSIQLPANTEMWVALTWAKELSSTTIRLYSALDTAQKFTQIATGVLNSARHDQDTYIYISPSANEGLNGVHDDIWFMPDEVISESNLDYIFLSGPGPYTGAKYGSNFDGRYTFEKGEAVSFNHSPYWLASGGFIPKGAQTSNSSPVDDEIVCNIEAGSKEALSSRLDSLQNILGGAATWSAFSASGHVPAVDLRYRSLIGGEQLSYRVISGSITLPPGFGRRTVKSGDLIGVVIRVIRENTGRGGWIRTADSRTFYNYSTTVAQTSPLIVSALGDVPSPARIIVKNPSATGYTSVKFGISPVSVSPLNFVKDLSGVRRVSAFGEEVSSTGPVVGSTAYTQITSFTVTSKLPRTRYRVYAKGEVSSIVPRYVFRLMDNTNDFTNDTATLVEANRMFTAINSLELFALGWMDFPSKAYEISRTTGDITTTLYLGCKTVSGSSYTVSIDYLLCFPAVTDLTEATISAFSSNQSFEFDKELGTAFVVTADRQDIVHGSITSIMGGGPILTPGDNRICIWLSPSSGSEQDLTYNWWLEYQPRYLLMKS